MFVVSRYRQSCSKWLLFIAIVFLAFLPKFKSQVEVRHFTVPTPGLPVLATPANPSAAPGRPSSDYERLNSFLSKAKTYMPNAQTRIPDGDKVSVVLGNEAADLDSIVTAIVLGHYLDEIEYSERVFLPVINIPRADLILRKDASFLLEFVGISVRDLIFIDEIDMQSLSATGKVDFEVLLTDHNQLAEGQQFLSPFVKGIFDHHVKDHDLDSSRMKFHIIDPVGSCASLIALQLKESVASVPGYVDIVTPNVATMLMSVILLDTVNFNPQEKKTSDIDFIAYMWLYSRHGVSHESLFRTLQGLRGDISGLTTIELFRKDLKFRMSSGMRYAISSVSGVALQEWLAEDTDLFSKMETFAQQANVSLFCVLTNGITSGSFSQVMRDLVCLGSNGELLDRISESLTDSGYVQQNLNLNDLRQASPNLSVRLNNSSSRKRISPIIQNAVKQVNSRLENVDTASPEKSFI